eukprot:833485-Amphidinium_carterae.1
MSSYRRVDENDKNTHLNDQRFPSQIWAIHVLGFCNSHQKRRVIRDVPTKMGAMHVPTLSGGAKHP